jgi:hypothetical protein
MEVRMRFIMFSVLSLVGVLASSAHAQSVIEPPPYAKTVNLSGPRFGMTALSPGVVGELEKRSINVGSNITQFGWQFEKEFYAKGSGLAAVNEWVLLAGGLEQGHVLPSASWLVGLRTREGVEFGVGPNVTPAGVALVVAAGVTMRTETFNIPLNVAIVPSKVGTRVSVLTGFNMRRR